ncbi:hypothetical protein FBZ93_111237 [Bradyrhizobium macuxiense]|uniref:AbiTii domain-containing protein n=1 Tax=Bradyrhizobium macuxiense TaxID=1755647 RepID=A0A560LCA9_9BRAD|nr:hypothetical protein [Bradyrhizobium macuxiense]TWB93198.1 hypothetical protein FBZ93_111237 [Bradyrhizobium macuxiense]
MTDQRAYVGRSLNQRAYDAADKAANALETLMRQNVAVGRLASGHTLIGFKTEGLRVFNEEFASAAKFTHNLLGQIDEETLQAVSYFANRLVDLIFDKLVLCGPRTGIAEATVARELNNIKVALQERRDRVLDDFAFGMTGDERMKKDPVVSIVNSQSNSPGAIQQAGVGEFSQSAIINHHQQVVAAIDRALVSQEFQQLDAAQKQGFRDVADVVKEEAAKPTPDPAKLKRWSERLVGLAREIGMRVAVSEIGQAIGHMLGGVG